MLQTTFADAAAVAADAAARLHAFGAAEDDLLARARSLAEAGHDRGPTDHRPRRGGSP
jgi:hypothetical protein